MMESMPLHVLGEDERDESSLPVLRTRTTCRICGSSALQPVLDLGQQRIAGVFPSEKADEPLPVPVPLELVRCDPHASAEACGLVQLRHTVSAPVLYQSYWYRSGVNRTMTENLHGIAHQAEELVELDAGDLVVDIGCNDGTLFDGYSRRDLGFLGFDPSDVSRYAVEKGYRVANDFFGPGHLDLAAGRAKVITSIAMFYDLDDPLAFVRNVAAALDPRGVWILELHYLPLMLEANAFDVVCHEHLAYYSLSVLERLLSTCGLEVFDAELNSMNGGSIRLVTGPTGSRDADTAASARLGRIRQRERKLQLDSAAPYRTFASRVAVVGQKLSDLVRQIAGQGKSIHVYGASTKGNVILQYAGLGRELIPYAADRNPDKWGSCTQTGIPIISEQDSRAQDPDFYLVLPWHFLEEFVEREKEYLEGGGRFIVPLPEVRVIER